MKNFAPLKAINPVRLPIMWAKKSNAKNEQDDEKNGNDIFRDSNILETFAMQNLAWWLKKSWNIVKNGCDFGSVTACFGLE